jgi:hypothetical protein
MTNDDDRRMQRSLLRALAADVNVRGPWRWSGHVKRQRGETTGVYLAGRRDDFPGPHMVVGFTRCGMQGAQPTFNVGGVMVPATDLAVFEVDYRPDIVALNHPAAGWIAACDPDTIVGLLDRIDELEAQLAATEPRPPRRWWRR